MRKSIRFKSVRTTTHFKPAQTQKNSNNNNYTSNIKRKNNLCNSNININNKLSRNGSSLISSISNRIPNTTKTNSANENKKIAIYSKIKPKSKFIVQNESELFSTKSLFCLRNHNKFRNFFQKIVSSNVFIGIITVLTLINCIFLVLETIPYFKKICEYVDYSFIAIFTLEFIFKIIAYGFIFGKYSYLRDIWNWLDFIALITSIMVFIPQYKSNLKALRSFRLIRSLKTTYFLPNMNLFLHSIGDSIIDLVLLFIFFLFFLSFFSILGLLLWSDIFEYRCIKNNEIDPLYRGHICGTINSCGNNLTNCVNIYRLFNATFYKKNLKQQNFNYGLTNFDNIFNSLITVFQVSSCEGWANVMSLIMDGYNSYVSFIFFSLCVIVNYYFMFNLIIAVLLNNFNHTRNRELHICQDQDDFICDDNKNYQLANKSTLNIFKNDKDNTQNDDFINLSFYKNLRNKDQGDDITEKIKTSNKQKAIKNLDIILNIDQHNYTSKIKKEKYRRKYKSINLKTENQRKYKIKKSFCQKITKIKKRIKCFESYTPNTEYHRNHPCAFSFYYFYKQPIVEYFFYFCILVNSVILAMERVNISKKEEDIISHISFCLVIIFTLELFFCIIAYGFTGIMSDILSIIDFIVVILSILEIILKYLNVLQTSSSGSIVSIFRILKMLRLFRLFRQQENFQVIIGSIGLALSKVIDSFLLILLFCFIYSLLGYFLFNNSLKFNSNGEYDKNAKSNFYNFDNIPNALVSVFIVVIGEQWNTLFYECYRSSKNRSYDVIIYFVTLVLFGQITLMNIFLAYLIDNFQRARIYLLTNLQVRKIMLSFVRESRTSLDNLVINYTELPKDNIGVPIYNYFLTKLKKQELIFEREFQFNLKSKIDFLINKKISEDSDSHFILSRDEENKNEQKKVYLDDFNKIIGIAPESKIKSLETYSKKEEFMKNYQKDFDTLLNDNNFYIIDKSIYNKDKKDNKNIIHVEKIKGKKGSILEREFKKFHIKKNMQIKYILAEHSGRVNHVECYMDIPEPIKINDEYILEEEDGAYENIQKETDSDKNAQVNVMNNKHINAENTNKVNFNFSNSKINMHKLINHNSSKIDSNTSRNKLNFSERFESNKNPINALPIIKKKTNSSYCTSDQSSKFENDLNNFTKNKLEIMRSLPKNPSVFRRNARGGGFIRKRYSLLIFDKENVFRKFCKSITNNKIYEKIIFIVILIFCFIICLDDKWVKPKSKIKKLINISNKIFIIIFFLEAFIKIVSNTLIIDKHSYLRDVINLCDLIVLIVNIIIIFKNNYFLKSLRALKILSAMRIYSNIVQNQNLNLLLETLKNALLPILNVCLACITFIIIFTLLGINIFKNDMLYYCNINSSIVKKNECEKKGGIWTYSFNNFSDFAKALKSNFILMTSENWFDFMKFGSEKKQSKWAEIYFIIYIIASYMIILNLMITTIIQSYMSIKSNDNELKNLRKPEKQIVKLQRFMVKFKTVPKNELTNPCRKIIYRIATSKVINLFLNIFLGVSLIILFLDNNKISDKYKRITLDVIFLFSFIFTLETAIKLIAFCRIYFYNIWNILDFIITISCDILIGIHFLIYFSIIKGSLELFHKILRVVYLFRAFRLLNNSVKLKILLETYFNALPSLGNTIIIIFILLYIYANIGMNIFGELPYRLRINKNNNFRDFINSIFLLFKTINGEEWADTMHEANYHNCNVNNSDIEYCYSYNITKCSTSLQIGLLSKGETSYCGTYFSYAFFISFAIIGIIILLNLCVVMVIEGFTKANYENIGLLPKAYMETFIRIWSEYDPNNKQYIKPFEFVLILKQLGPPLGYCYDRIILSEQLNKKREYFQLHIFKNIIKQYQTSNTNSKEGNNGSSIAKDEFKILPNCYEFKNFYLTKSLKFYTSDIEVLRIINKLDVTGYVPIDKNKENNKSKNYTSKRKKAKETVSDIENNINDDKSELNEINKENIHNSKISKIKKIMSLNSNNTSIGEENSKFYKENYIHFVEACLIISKLIISKFENIDYERIREDLIYEYTKKYWIKYYDRETVESIFEKKNNNKYESDSSTFSIDFSDSLKHKLAINILLKVHFIFKRKLLEARERIKKRKNEKLKQEQLISNLRNVFPASNLSSNPKKNILENNYANVTNVTNFNINEDIEDINKKENDYTDDTKDFVNKKKVLLTENFSIARSLKDDDDDEKEKLNKKNEEEKKEDNSIKILNSKNDDNQSNILFGKQSQIPKLNLKTINPFD